MGITKTTLGKFTGSAALALLLTSSAIAATVEISYENPGTSTTLDVTRGSDVTAGLSEKTIDGNTTFAASTSNTAPSTSTWTATVNTYVDVQAGAGKYNLQPKDNKKYSQAGYLFSLMDFSETLSDTAEKYNALVNYVIWDIMGSVPELASRSDRRIVKGLRKQIKGQKNFDWSDTMIVYTSNDRRTSRELFASVPPPIATPIPSAIFLFGSMALGLFGIATRKRLNA